MAAHMLYDGDIMSIPVVALRGLNIFPGMVINFDLKRSKSINAVRAAMKSDALLYAVAQREVTTSEPELEDMYNIGTVILVKQITKLPGGTMRVLAEGRYRAYFDGIDPTVKQYILGEIHPVTEDDGHISEDKDYEEGAKRTLFDILTEYTSYHPKVNQSLQSQINKNMVIGEIVNRIAMNIPIAFEKKQEILEKISSMDRFTCLSRILCEEANIAGIQNELSKEIKQKVEKNQREYILREQMSYIKKELAGDGEYTDAELFERQVEELNASDEVKDKLRKEIKRFSNMSDSSSESAVGRTYIETLLEMPWNNKSEDNNDINNAKKILDEDHFGMDKVKDRILEFLAVRSLTDKGQSPIICLVGPPGTGKTSIAKSVAKSLKKEYVRICLGGVRDEAEIRGHRRTYIGAMPGRIATGIKSAGVSNPLMLLDEIDKVSSDYKGDCFSALLEVLDPDQNKGFRDHYIEVPLDLSEVLFIATANDTSNIPRPLLDRMEIVEVLGYTANEKFHIAKEHLIKKQYEANGMSRKSLTISDAAIKDIIRYYTREAGVRGLEREIGRICRKAALQLLTSEDMSKISVKPANLNEYLGKRKYSVNPAAKKAETGIVRGLAWTAVGGDTLEIEVNIMPGKGVVILTGKMGDVMKESAGIAMSYVRSVAKDYKVEPSLFAENDFHIHIPEGAVPKDGPSAGITMATAILSAVTDKKVQAQVAMTGEVTLRGKVLPIGGLKEKLLAANMAGIKKVLVPKENEKDILELSDEIIGDMNIVYVEYMNDVVKEAFV